MASLDTPVARHGWLQVQGRHLLNGHGRAIQLRGMSSHGMQWFANFINRESLQHLRDDWRIDVIRLAMYLDEGGYAQRKEVRDVVARAINLAIDAGVYVVVDWHVHQHPEYPHSGDPNKYRLEAVTFFADIARSFGSGHPNIIYEIANEPAGVSWQDIREYASAVIPAIRTADVRNVIVVGTPNWSQDVHVAEQTRLEVEHNNIAYSLHFYAGARGHDHLRSRVRQVVAKNLPLFVTEWGASDHTGDGAADKEATAEWMQLLNEEKISWINWSLCDKREGSAALRPGASETGPWPEAELSPSGVIVRGHLLDPKP